MNLEHIKQKFKSGNEVPVPGAYVTQEEFQFLLSKLRDEQGASNPVADERVGPRHPVVIKWRNNGIEACAGIADAYGMNQAAIDMRAMLTKGKEYESNSALARSASMDTACDGRGVFRGLRGDGVSGIALASAPVAGEAIAGYMVGTDYFRPDVLAAARIYAENRGLTVRPLVYGDAAPQASGGGLTHYTVPKGVTSIFLEIEKT